MANEEVLMSWIDSVLLPHADKVRKELGKPELTRVLLLDDFRAHWTHTIQDYLASSNFVTVKVPPGFTDYL